MLSNHRKIYWSTLLFGVFVFGNNKDRPEVVGINDDSAEDYGEIYLDIVVGFMTMTRMQNSRNANVILIMKFEVILKF